jgi:hypothetical protein
MGLDRREPVGPEAVSTGLVTAQGGGNAPSIGEDGTMRMTTEVIQLTALDHPHPSPCAASAGASLFQCLLSLMPQAS